MNLLNKLTKKNLILNKKRTTVTIIGIILSVALITALSSLVISFKHSALVFEKKRSGDYHIAFSHVLFSDVEKLKSNRFIEEIYFSRDVGYAKLDGIKNEDKPYVFVKAYDFTSLEKMVKSNILEGRLPQTSNEIVISKHLKTNGRLDLKVGDTINLGIGARLAEDDENGEYPLDQSNPYNEENEIFEHKYDKEYKIVGIIERPGYSSEPYTAPGYTFITCLDDTNESMYTAYVRYKHKYLNKSYRVTANILGIDADIYEKGMTSSFSLASVEEFDKFMESFQNELDKARYDVENVNDYLISLEYQNLSDPSMKALYMVALIVIAIIMVTSIYCIKNSFNISITKKTKQYGMLASIGATRKQVKKNVLYEAFVLGLISIPLGIISGLFASFVLIKVSNYFLAEALNMSLVYKISIGAILLSILLGAITIYLSAIKSARKASKISPITAIRNNDDIKIKSKKIKSPKIIKKLFGVGGDVSYKNLKRNNKKYRTTVISIVVCVSVFIALYSFMNLAFKAVDMSYKGIDFNISISYRSSNKEKEDSVTKSILNIEGIKDYSINNSVNFTLKNPKFTDNYMKYEGENVNNLLNEDEKSISLVLYSLGDYQYNKYLNSLGLSYDDAKDKVIILNKTNVFVYDEKNGGKHHELNIFDYKKGDTIEGEFYDYDCKKEDADECWFSSKLEVIDSVNEAPFGIADPAYTGTYYAIVSDELLNKYAYSDYHEMLIDVDNADKFQDEAEKILTTFDDYHLSNFDKERKESKSLFTLIAIFLYGFIIVIALIGITNIFNTITTSIELRSREFATLKSVGMTKREFNRMVSLESIFYGTKSLLIGIPIGSLLSYLIYKALMDGNMEFSYSYPIVAVVISIVAVFILVTAIMKYSMRKINKQNTIETIRNDNI